MNSSIYHIWSVLCQTSATDSGTNNISLFNILESVQGNLDTKGKEGIKEILIPINFQLVSSWRRKDTKNTPDAELIIDIIDPKLKKLRSEKVPLKFIEGKKGIRLAINMSGLIYTQDGEYTFIISIKFKNRDEAIEVIQLPLDITVSPLK